MSVRESPLNLNKEMVNVSKLPGSQLEIENSSQELQVEESPSKMEAQVEPPSFEEGGIKAWCTVAGAWLALFATFGYISSFGVYQDLYTRAGLASTSNVSWIGSVQTFIFVAMGLPAGKLLDKGYFKITIVVGSIIYVFSLFMLSLAHLDKYYQIFLAQGVGMGIGSGLIYLPATAVQAHHWRAHRALAMGIVITGSSVGGIVYPIMLNNLFHGSAGFAWGVRASAFLTLGVLAASVILMSDKPHSSPNYSAVTKKVEVKEIFMDIPFIIVVIVGGCFVVLGLFFPYFYLQLFTDLHGFSPTFGFYTLTIQNGASIFGRIIPNFFADKYGVINVEALMFFGTGVVIFAMFGIKNVAGVVVFAVFYGFFSGSVLSIFTPVLASFVRHPSELGIRFGVAYSLVSFAYLIGPPICGALVGSDFAWFKPIIFSGTVIIGGSVPAILVGRSLQAKRKGTHFV